MLYDPIAVDCVSNSGRSYCLINSLAFHPSDNDFCATYSGKCLLVLYRIEASGRVRMLQKIHGEATQLTVPQHTVFTRDGNGLLAVNWVGESFTLLRRPGRDAAFDITAAAVVPFPPRLAGYKPHGIEVSPSGRFVAVAFGASSDRPKALAVFRCEAQGAALTLLTVVEGPGLPGIPKGIAFSPDETRLLVTFSDAHANCLCVFGFDPASGVLDQQPQQTVSDHGLCRPEDIKFSHDGGHVLVSNSGANTVDAYRFDAAAGRIPSEVPEQTLTDGRVSPLNFPHGVAVSPDGAFLVVSQFGPLPMTPDEDIVFGSQTAVRQAKIGVYRRSSASRPWWQRQALPWAPWVWEFRDRLERRS